jgi:ubiquinone/menaquinone biosynthesis C-methylase UbiE
VNNGFEGVKLNQKKIFLTIEGDEYYERNRKKYDDALKTPNEDPIVQCLFQLDLSPKKVLEIGCGNGWRLNILNNIYKTVGYGLDPSEKAIQRGKEEFPQLHLEKGTAEQLPYEKSTFDLVIFGFCLYLCDRHDLFKIAYEADRVLEDFGHIVIYDFHPPFHYKNDYAHYNGLYSYKMNYSNLFLWNPSYTLRYQKLSFHPPLKKGTFDDVVSVMTLEKNVDCAFPYNPYREI